MWHMLTAVGGGYPEDRFCPGLRDETERWAFRDNDGDNGSHSERHRPGARWAARLHPRQRPARLPAEGRCQAFR